MSGTASVRQVASDMGPSIDVPGRVRSGINTLSWAAKSGGSRGVRETASSYAKSSQVSGVNLIGVMFAIILAAAVGMVGTVIIYNIDNSVDVGTNNSYANASESISTGFANAMGLTDIVFLVLMFVVVIGALFLARRAGQM